ncbi:MAG: HEAT repeat domain-containing protein, partial [Planctomycetes bacterium]|nr:HEAT repeat domain-containing protein [Planctomycetota bacterium]
ATAELKRIGAQAVPALEKAAKDHEDLEIRHRAQQILGGFVYTNRDFLMSFALLGDAALPRLAEIVGKADAVECALAAEVLGEIGSPGALEILERLAAHESPVVQARVATALSLFSCERSLSLLRQLSQSGDQDVWLAAVESLGRRDDEAALPVALARLEDPDARIRQGVCQVLTRYFSRPGREELLEARFRENMSLFVKRFCLNLLARSPSKRGAAFLMATASNPRHEDIVREEALVVLGTPGFPGARKFLEEFAAHRGGALAEAAARSLAGLPPDAGSGEEGK